ncbi:hypothetical protein B0H14DRAFT_2888169 [Mycena olivaceomarginata]|nr:hypothetical protein B0H14DRAFT_2888169 [Mycena olivaceomarginata]
MDENEKHRGTSFGGWRQFFGHWRSQSDSTWTTNRKDTTVSPLHALTEDSSAKFWSVYISEAEHYDSALVESWKADMEGMLIFSGLFSASLTAFIIESYKSLVPDTGNMTVDLLSQLSQQLNAQFNGSHFTVLTCALLATLVEQWAREFLHKTERSTLLSGAPGSFPFCITESADLEYTPSWTSSPFFCTSCAGPLSHSIPRHNGSPHYIFGLPLSKLHSQLCSGAYHHEIIGGPTGLRRTADAHTSLPRRILSLLWSAETLPLQDPLRERRQLAGFRALWALASEVFGIGRGSLHALSIPVAYRLSLDAVSIQARFEDIRTLFAARDLSLPRDRRRVHDLHSLLEPLARHRDCGADPRATPQQRRNQSVAASFCKNRSPPRGRSCRTSRRPCRLRCTQCWVIRAERPGCDDAVWLHANLCAGRSNYGGYRRKGPDSCGPAHAWRILLDCERILAIVDRADTALAACSTAKAVLCARILARSAELGEPRHDPPDLGMLQQIAEPGPGTNDLHDRLFIRFLSACASPLEPPYKTAATIRYLRREWEPTSVQLELAQACHQNHPTRADLHTIVQCLFDDLDPDGKLSASITDSQSQHNPLPSPLLGRRPGRSFSLDAGSLHSPLAGSSGPWRD